MKKMEIVGDYFGIGAGVTLFFGIMTSDYAVNILEFLIGRNGHCIKGKLCF